LCTRPTSRRRVENYNCDAREGVGYQDRQELNDQQSTGHRAVRLPYRSNSIVRSRGLPSLVLCSCLHNAVGMVWDGVGCRWSGSLGIDVRWWLIVDM